MVRDWIFSPWDQEQGRNALSTSVLLEILVIFINQEEELKCPLGEVEVKLSPSQKSWLSM